MTFRRCVSPAFFFAGALLLVWPVRAAEIEGEHYRVYTDEGIDAAESAGLLDALHRQLSLYYGRAPEGKLRVEVYSTQERFKEALARDRQPYSGGGGVYGPTFKKAWLFRQPSANFTRQLTLHEASHQFHFLVATDNRFPSAGWYTEGWAEYTGMHNWDGQRLRIGVVPAISLEDYPRSALESLEKINWNLAALIDGTEKLGRPAGWALVHFLINDDLAKFRQLAQRLDQREDPAESFRAVYGEVTPELVGRFRNWIADNQQPWEWEWNSWQQRGQWIEGSSGVVATCTLKGDPPPRLAVQMHPVKGYVKAGVVFGFVSRDDFYLMQIWGSGKDRSALVMRRAEGKWKTLARAAVAPPTGQYDQLEVVQDGDAGKVALSINGRQVHALSALGRVGLTVDGCTARFLVPQVAAGPGRELAAILGVEIPDREQLAAALGPGADQAPSDGAAPPAQGPAAEDKPSETKPAEEKPVDPKSRDDQGRTPLHLAAGAGDLAAVEKLIAAGAEVEAVQKNGVTPLLAAAGGGHREVMAALLEAGAKVGKATPRGTTALHYAASRGDLPVIELLLEAKADANAAMSGGTTPLVLAAQNGRTEALGALIAAGAKVNVALAAGGVTPLMLAAQNGHEPVVAALLAAGADRNAKDREGRTALSLAQAKMREGVIRLLGGEPLPQPPAPPEEEKP